MELCLVTCLDGAKAEIKEPSRDTDIRVQSFWDILQPKKFIQNRILEHCCKLKTRRTNEDKETFFMFLQDVLLDEEYLFDFWLVQTRHFTPGLCEHTIMCKRFVYLNPDYKSPGF